jgi:hypothetical protein
MTYEKLPTFIGNRDSSVSVVTVLRTGRSRFRFLTEASEIYLHNTWKVPRQRRRWEDNIKMDLQEVGGVRGDWMELAQDRDRWRALVGTVRNFRVP